MPPRKKELIAAAGDPEEMVRLAALERLGQVGSAASIPVLFQAATAGSRPARRRPLPPRSPESLAPAPAPPSRSWPARATPGSRVVAINALAQRNDQTALPALLKYAGESDPGVSAAACAALAKLGTDNELEGLIRLVLAGKTPGAPAALQAVASRGQG